MVARVHRWALVAISLLWGRGAAADAMPRGILPPCPPGSDWRPGGAGHLYCAPLACADAPCPGSAACVAATLCLRPRRVGIGTVDEVVAREGSGCPADARPSDERVCIPSGPAPSPQKPSPGCGCQQGPAPAVGPLALLAVASLVALRRGRRGPR